MVTTKTSVHFNKRMANYNLTGVFAEFSGRAILN